LARIDEFVFNKVDAAYDDSADEAAVSEAKEKFCAALDNDLNTPQAFAALFDFIRAQTKKKNPASGRLNF